MALVSSGGSPVTLAVSLFFLAAVTFVARSTDRTSTGVCADELLTAARSAIKIIHPALCLSKNLCFINSSSVVRTASSCPKQSRSRPSWKSRVAGARRRITRVLGRTDSRLPALAALSTSLCHLLRESLAGHHLA